MKPPCDPEMKCRVLHGIGWNGIIAPPHETGIKMGILDEKPCPLYLDVHKKVHIEVVPHFFLILQKI
jgi:hypothetical protein